MAEHNELGKLGEEMAVEYLQRNGYVILGTNWRFQKAEIDILAQKDDILAVVEVKTRSSLEFGLPQDFVKPKKIKLLLKAVDAYVVERNLDVNVRFDIIAITASIQPSESGYKGDKSFVIEHLTDAFYYYF